MALRFSRACEGSTSPHSGAGEGRNPQVLRLPREWGGNMSVGPLLPLGPHVPSLGAAGPSATLPNSNVGLSTRSRRQLGASGSQLGSPGRLACPLWVSGHRQPTASRQTAERTGPVPGGPRRVSAASLPQQGAGGTEFPSSGVMQWGHRADGRPGATVKPGGGKGGAAARPFSYPGRLPTGSPLVVPLQSQR